MKTIYKIQINIILVAMMLLLGSCANDITQGGTGTDSGSETLKIAFNIAQPKTVDDGNAVKATRSMTTAQESEINSISIVVFNTSDEKVGEYYATFSSTKTATFYASVPVAVASSYKIYAVANASSTTITSMKAATTLTTFNAISESLSSVDDLNNATSLVMFGKATATGNTNTNGVGSTTSITLSRLAAKITLNLTSSNDYTITGYQICSTPMSSFVSSDNLSTTNTSGTNYNAKNTYNSQTEVSGLTVKNASTSANIFMYENMAGVNSASKAPALRISLKSPKKATYLVVYATSSSSVKYKFTYYLGGSSASDITGFDIARNTNYIYNINISGADLADMRVLSPGEYLFSDGTWGTIANNSTKTPIAVIFGLSPSATDKGYGWTNGYAMALKNAATKIIWASSSAKYVDKYLRTDTPDNTYAGWLIDMDGYTATQMIINNTGDYSSSTYPACYYAVNYATIKSVTTPNTTSGWFLPSRGQLYQIAANLGGLSGSGVSGTNIKYSNMASSIETAINIYLSPVSGDLFTNINANWLWGSSEMAPSGAAILQANFGDYYLNMAIKNYDIANVNVEEGCSRPVIAF